MLFGNRDKFDLIAICDEDSTRNSPAASALIRAIYERSFTKILRNIPMLLVGGLKAWKEEFGDSEVVHGGVEIPFEVAPPSPSPNGLNGVGISASSSSSSTNGLGITGVNVVNGLNGIVAPIASRPALGHSRTPAESTSSPLFSPSLPDPSTFASPRSRAGTSAVTTPAEVNGYKMWIPPSNVSDQMPSR